MKKIYLLLIALIVSAGSFAQTTYYLDVVDYGLPANSSETHSTGYSINGEIQEYDGFTGQASIHVAVIDSATCAPMSNCNIDAGQVNTYNDPNGDCITDVATTYSNRSRAENYFIFRSADNTQMQSMAAFIDSIPDGNFILIYTWFPSTYSTMDASFDTVLIALGATVIPSLADELPFIFFCKKGDTGTAQEVTGALINSMITLNTSFQCSPTGVEELNSGSFHAYPNPAVDNLKIEFSGKGNIRMMDAIGKIVFEKNDVQNSMIINTSDFEQGIYNLELITEEKNLCKKISVRKN
jgi:hypothetical protein